MACEVRSIVPFPIPRNRLRKLVNHVLRSLRFNQRTTNVSLAIVDSRTMRRLNRRYHNARTTTDVLSFPGMRFHGQLHGISELGEIVVCLPQAQKQAQIKRHPLITEVEFLIVHGLLHLAGYDHTRAKERTRMELAEQRFLRTTFKPRRTGLP